MSSNRIKRRKRTHFVQTCILIIKNKISGYFEFEPLKVEHVSGACRNSNVNVGGLMLQIILMANNYRYYY